MTIVEEPMCPRCGYDLRGAVASWREVCPVEGVCSECGLRYAWPDVLLRPRQLDTRFIEHAKGVRGSFRASMRTLLWTLNPWGFWRRVRLNYGIRLCRGAAWLGAMVVVLWLLQALSQMWGLVRWAWQDEFIDRGQAWTMWQAYATRLTEPMVRIGWAGTVVEYRTALGDYPPMLRALIATTLAWPALLMTLSQSRLRVNVRSGHIARAFLYSWSWLLWLLIAACAWQLGDNVAVFRQTIWSEPLWTWDVSAALPLWYGTGLLTLTLLMGWLNAWWFVVIRHHWRMPSARAVWLTLAMPVNLFGAIVGLWP